MPIGYLFTIGLLGVCTAAALIPPPGYGRAGRISYFLAVVISEVPHFGALWLILSTALALSEGDLDGPVGTVLLALSAIILLGLLVVLRRCLQARSVVTALIRAHTEPRRGSTSSAPPPRWTWLRPLLFPVPLRPRSVMRIGGLSYGEHRRQRLDVYRFRNQTLSGPVLVYFHGGGYSSGGNRREARALLHHLAVRGWVCISATYRLRPTADFTDHLDDARAVLRWTRDNGVLHGGDASTIVMAGSSAGAHLTSLIALGQGADVSPPLSEEAELTHEELTTPRIAAALCLYGYYGRYYGRSEDEHPVSTPLAMDASAAPPMFFVHGDNDSWTPIDDARELSKQVATASIQPTWYAEFPGGQHGLDSLFSWRFAAIVHGFDRFLAHIGIAPQPDPNPPQPQALPTQQPSTHRIGEGAES